MLAVKALLFLADVAGEKRFFMEWVFDSYSDGRALAFEQTARFI